MSSSNHHAPNLLSQTHLYPTMKTSFVSTSFRVFGRELQVLLCSALLHVPEALLLKLQQDILLNFPGMQHLLGNADNHQTCPKFLQKAPS